MRLLTLLTDAYGGQGGIAKFNRDLCWAVSEDPLGAKVTAVPRVPPVEEIGEIPSNVSYETGAAGSKAKYGLSVMRTLWKHREATFDGVVCAHINLLPAAVASARLQKAWLLLIVHGIDAWEPHPSVLVRASLPHVDQFVAVSNYTKRQFLEWAPLGPDSGSVIPNCIDPESYGPGPKDEDLLARYGLEDCTVLLTLGRLSQSEQYKGHDEVLELLPELVTEFSDIAYLICGDGNDRGRLEAKARDLGVKDRVVFAGYVPEEEKADHYRLADAFVMPGYGEGFGITYLEAMACGIPVVASSADASCEAVRNGDLGQVVDPDQRDDVLTGVRNALNDGRGTVPDGLSYFSTERFRERWHRLLKDGVEST